MSYSNDINLSKGNNSKGPARKKKILRKRLFKYNEIYDKRKNHLNVENWMIIKRNHCYKICLKY